MTCFDSRESTIDKSLTSDTLACIANDYVSLTVLTWGSKRPERV